MSESEIEQWAQKIAKGHARRKHWPSLSEAQLAEKIRSILRDPRRSYPPGDGHPWKIIEANDRERTILILDEGSDDGGTCFAPDYTGYFDDQVEIHGAE